MGFTGQKGRVHIHFAEPISLENSANFREVSQQLITKVDENVQWNYKLWPTNCAASKIIEGGNLSSGEQVAKAYLDQRCAQCTRDEVRFLLEMYANPVRKQMS